MKQNICFITHATYVVKTRVVACIFFGSLFIYFIVVSYYNFHISLVSKCSKRNQKKNLTIHDPIESSTLY